MTIGDNQTISASDLNTEADSRRSTTNTIRSTTAGLRVTVSVYDFATGGDAVTRQVIFTPQDNYELVSLWLYGENLNGSQTSTLTLAVASGETEYILDDTVSMTLTHAGGDESLTGDYSDTTATRYVLRKGVAYSLTLSGDDTADILQGTATFKLKRRTS